ncbi:MAG TPA: hypothetical protein VFI55_06920 [Mycobacterium sp.]|nr:hypothetical protein [Mycobacterium sp.]
MTALWPRMPGEPPADRYVVRAGVLPDGWEGCPVFARPADVAEALRCRDATSAARMAGCPEDEALFVAEDPNNRHDSMRFTDPGRLVLRRVISRDWALRAAARFRPVVGAAFDYLALRGEVDACVGDDLLPRLIRWVIFAPGVDSWADVAAQVPVRRAEGAQGDDLVSRVIRFAPQLSDQEVFVLSASSFGVAGGAVGFIGTLFTSTLAFLGADTDVQRRLRGNPSDIPVFVDEMARLKTTTPLVSRHVTADTQIGGVDLPKGSAFIVATGEASVGGENGERVNLSPRRHWGFSAGPYRCTGIHLVHATIQVAVEEFLARIPEFRLCDERVVATRHPYGHTRFNSAPLAWDG